MMDKIEFAQIAELFGLTVKDLFLLLNNPDIYYCDFKIPKRSGGFREISIPSLKLMAIQRAILKQILKPNFKPLSCCVGFVNNLNILDNVKPHLGNDYILKTDLKNFFSSITSNQVNKLFSSLGYSHKISAILTKLCCRLGSIPQGAPTSPMISNMVMVPLDRKIQSICDYQNFTYTRYADDITISSNTPIEKGFLDILSNLITQYNMSINVEKTHFYGPNTKKIITGISISSGEAKLPRATKRKIRQEINMIRKFGLLSHMEKTGQMSPLFIASIKGKLAFWRQIEPNNPFIIKAFEILKNAVKQLDEDE